MGSATLVCALPAARHWLPATSRPSTGSSTRSRRICPPVSIPRLKGAARCADKLASVHPNVARPTRLVMSQEERGERHCAGGSHRPNRGDKNEREIEVASWDSGGNRAKT